MTDDGRLYDEWMGNAAKARADQVKRRIQAENDKAEILEAYKPPPTEFDDDLADMRAAENGPADDDMTTMVHRAFRELMLSGSAYLEFPKAPAKSIPIIYERPGR